MRRDIIETDILLLELNDLDYGQIKEVVDHVKDASETDFIDANVLLMANIFDKILIQIQKIYKSIKNIPQDILEEIFTIYSNIENIPNVASEDEKKVGSVILLRFLGFLRSHNEISGDNSFVDYSPVEDIIGLISNDLEKVRFIFDYDINGKLYFPIDKLIVGVIKNSSFINKGSCFETSDYYALKLAVRFFSTEVETETIKVLEEIKTKCNLRLIDYLGTDSQMIDDGMRSYNKNGAMVFWNSATNCALIRANSENYFDINVLKEYDLQVDHESTFNGETTIASFVEIQYEAGSKTICAENLLNDCERRKDLIWLLYKGYRNIFLPSAIRETSAGQYVALNPFGTYDSYVIKGGKDYLVKETIDLVDVLREYYNLSLLRSRQYPMNRLSIGAFVSLTSIDDTNWEELLDNYSDDDFYQNQLIERWLDGFCIRDKAVACTEKLLIALYNDLQYCSSNDFKDHDISIQKFYPHKIKISVLVNHLDEAFSDGCFQVVNGVLREKDEGKEIAIIEEESLRLFRRNEIIDKEGYLETLTESNAYFIEHEEKIYVYDFNAIKALFGLNRIIEKCLDYETIVKVSDGKYTRIHSAVELHKIGLKDSSSKGFPSKIECFDDEIYYRISHNMIGYDIKKENVDAYFDVFFGHDLLSFKSIKDDRLFCDCVEETRGATATDISGDSLDRTESVGTLYVPKEGKSSGNVLSDIYEEYIRPRSRRDVGGLYDGGISVQEDREYVKSGKIIKKIVFLFDNFERGTGTVNSLKAYLQPHLSASEVAIERARQRAMRYYLKTGNNEKEISIGEIAKNNNCKIEVHAYYGTAEAKRVVTDYLSKIGYTNAIISYHQAIIHKIKDISEPVEKIWKDKQLAKIN